MSDIIFVTGVHGVGKNTFISKMKRDVSLVSYEASSLIRKIKAVSDSEKRVHDIAENQNTLLMAIDQYVVESLFILDGHTVLISEDNSIRQIEDDFFDSIHINSVICLWEEPSIICERLNRRDGSDWDIDFIRQFQEAEIAAAKDLAFRKKKPFFLVESTDDRKQQEAIQLIKKRIF